MATTSATGSQHHDGPVTCRVADHVAQVRLARPDKLNALDAATFEALVETADRLAADRTVRAVVLAGEGRSFCAGIDVSALAAMGQGDQDPKGGPPGGSSGIVARLPGRITNRFQEVAHAWTAMPQPVIAALHGHVFGGGLQIALGADIRLASAEATLSVMEIRWGLLPDMTGPHTLVRLVGLDVAKELAFTGRRVDGVEAHRLGLVTRLADEPIAEATELAHEIAGRNPHAVQGVKELLNQAPRRPLAEGFIDESERMAALIGSPNQVEAVTAELEGRRPRFSDPG